MMAKDASVNEKKFQKMLIWLDQDVEKAGQVYETIRLRLTKIFYSRGCPVAEELADQTIDRVMKKIDDIYEDYEGDPRLYFYGVGRNVFLEYTRKPIQKELPDVLIQKEDNTGEKELRDRCLTACLKKLDADERAFILRYYRGDKTEKIERRRRMKEEYDLSFENLRVRAYRIRMKLQKCVLKKIKILDL